MTNTDRLNLFKVPSDPAEQDTTNFNTETMMNENWEKIDAKVAVLGPDGKIPSDQIDVDTSNLATKQELQTVDNKVTTHLAEKASLTTEGHVQLSDATNSTSKVLAATPSAVKEAMDRADAAFTSASNGKQAVGNAITGVDDGVVIPTDPTYQELADAIGEIETGKKWASGENEVVDGEIIVTDLGFTPSIVVASGKGGYGSRGNGSSLAVIRIDDSLHYGYNHEITDAIIASHTFNAPGNTEGFRSAHEENFITLEGFVVGKTRYFSELNDGSLFTWWAFE